jgi:hypothetical protein
MRKHRIPILLLLLLLAAVAADLSYGKTKGETGRLLTGKVIDHQGNPVADAVVYLSDTRTRGVKTFIVGPDGAYRFPALSPNIDYEVYAQYNGHKSDTKTVSQFDDRLLVNIVLRIDTK